MLTKAYEANPDSYYILDSLAWAHYKKKEYKKYKEKTPVLFPRIMK